MPSLAAEIERHLHLAPVAVVLDGGQEAAVLLRQVVFGGAAQDHLLVDGRGPSVPLRGRDELVAAAAPPLPGRSQHCYRHWPVYALVDALLPGRGGKKRSSVTAQLVSSVVSYMP